MVCVLSRNLACVSAATEPTFMQSVAEQRVEALLRQIDHVEQASQSEVLGLRMRTAELFWLLRTQVEKLGAVMVSPKLRHALI